LIGRANLAASRMERAFAALMEKARIEVGVVEPKRQCFALDLLFDELLDQHQDEARRKSLELRVVPSGETVLFDPPLLASILHNLEKRSGCAAPIEMSSSPSVRDNLERIARLYEGLAKNEEIRRTHAG
jgi:hypothetical protein